MLERGQARVRARGGAPRLGRGEIVIATCGRTHHGLEAIPVKALLRIAVVLEACTWLIRRGEIGKGE